MNKWITLFLLFSALTSYGQYTYTYTDPCTLVQKSVYVPAGGGVVVNYFDNHSTFTSNDFSSGVFDNWIAQVSQQNSNSPCESVTTTIVNGITNITVANTLTVVTNVISVTNVAQSIATIGGSMGSSMTATAGGVTNSSQSEGGSTNQNSKDDKKSNSNTPAGSNSGTTGTGSTGNQNQGSQTNPSTTGGTSSQPSSGTSQQGGDTTGTDQPTSTGSPTSESSVEESSGGNNLANSLSNSVDGGSADGGSSSGGASGGKKKSNSSAKNVGSLIASGDIVAIANTDQTQNFRFVGSITHANTRGTRIKGVLFNFTSGVNNLNVTFYKSWINKSKKLNTVGAQSIMMDFDKNFFSTTTVLESYKVSNKLTGMFGVNFTAGKMGERSLLNLSAVGGAHSSFKVNNRVSTSILVLGVYSPFTQFYEGKWWDAGIIVVPFNSWDLKITKTFKFNISFTGVYEVGQQFLNYQILTGGKLTF
ncbi:hypothetical protein immuto35A_18 [Flavobacterium phage vB_FspM_immuto_3-5A]|uniref:Uncharacterized protein n=1 Tax=Flavobacterium phage vB_FspM_immuto_2-6A TaxID=2801477 RepID=A0A7T8IWV4_9CAUD|nr:hypothetical protein KNV73_gp018 [Flavobacterium phage vB_FspM_immuto_2-6A]QQO91697.1 hypothetical protein immuto26A_18 [Flavobacterium phage vB_FspM_immuto_2-6A]QQO91936.1 hypothetical protein immuto35A_18 [Flavobacterium phage vB_FspM_immuto_3-5A]QQO92174.1 hypothetical protein immuto136C_18 [Flavobacterium phage vB_FspM_immuto_13-6C]